MAPALPMPLQSSNIFVSNPNSSVPGISSNASFLLSSSCSFNCAARPLSSDSSTIFPSPGKSSVQSLPPLLNRVLRVSIAPVEYVPPSPNFDFRKEIAKLKGLKSKLCNCSNLGDKLRTIDSDSRVRSFFNAGFGRLMGELNLDNYEVFLLKCLVAAGQEHLLGEFGSEFVSKRSSLKTALYALADMIEKWETNGADSDHRPGRVGFGLGEEEVKALMLLLKSLREIEQFYDCIGGIIGAMQIIS